MRLIILMSLLCIFLAGCEEKRTLEYLLTHPKYLEQQESRCNSAVNKDKEIHAAGCEEVVKAARTFSKLVEQQQTEPEKFGQKIINDQMNMAEAKKRLQAAEEKVNNHAEEDPLAHNKLKDARQAYSIMQLQVNTELAVIGLNRVP